MDNLNDDQRKSFKVNVRHIATPEYGHAVTSGLAQAESSLALRRSQRTGDGELDLLECAALECLVGSYRAHMAVHLHVKGRIEKK